MHSNTGFQLFQIFITTSHNRVFQIALKGDWEFPSSGGGWKILLGGVFFYCVVEIQGGVQLTIFTFSKLKNNILQILNID